MKKIKTPFLVNLNTSGINNSKKNNNLVGRNFIKGKSFVESPLSGHFDLKKRINEKNSVYSISQWKKDFKKSRIYKKISCEYPTINFVAKPKRKIMHNFVFSPTKDFNIFSGIRFKPFESFEEEENSKGSKSKSLSKKKKKITNLILLNKYK